MKNRPRLLPFILLALLLSCLSCGKKGDPTLKIFEKPLPVESLSALHREDAVIISWSYPRRERDRIKGFLLEKAEDGRFQKTASLDSEAGEYRDRDFTVGREYTYRIRAVSLREVMSPDSPLVKVTPAQLPPPPEGLSFSLTRDALEVAWKSAGEGVLYNLYRTREKGKYGDTPVNRTPLAEPLFRDRIETEGPVWYTVRSLLSTPVRDEGNPSAELAVDPVSFVPAAPTGLRYVPSDRGAYLLWNESDETWVRGYRIYRKRDGEQGFTAVGESSVPAFLDREVRAARAWYCVTSLGPVKESRPSETTEILMREDR